MDSSGLPHLVVLPHDGVLWQTVCAAVKQHQRAPSLWKQELWLFIHPNPVGLFTHCQPKAGTRLKEICCIVKYSAAVMLEGPVLVDCTNSTVKARAHQY